MHGVYDVDLKLKTNNSFFVDIPSNDGFTPGLMDLKDDYNGTDFTLEQSYLGDYPLIFTAWTTVVPLVILISVTLVGNGTVITMFVKTKKLRNFKYSFIASLATADFLIGCTEPASLLETASGRWPHDWQQCKVFLIFRYSLCYMSLLSILLISFDRWWSIHHPFSYRVKQSKRLAMWTIVCGWIFSFLLHGLPLISWEYLNDSVIRRDPDSRTILNSTIQPCTSGTMCLPPYEGDFLFTFTSTVLENFVPLILLVVLNLSVYIKIRKRKSTKIRRSLSTTDNVLFLSRKSSSESETGNQEEEQDILQDYLRRTPNRRRSSSNVHARRHSISHTLFNNASGCRLKGQTKRRVSFDVNILSHQFVLRRTSHGAAPRGSVPCRRRSTGDELVRDLFIKQDKKAACALGLLVIVFAVCWTPHCVLSIIRSSCGDCVPQWMLMVTHWIIAINSAINPFLYAIGNSEFRKVLKTWAGFERQLPSKHRDSKILDNSYYLLVS